MISSKPGYRSFKMAHRCKNRAGRIMRAGIGGWGTDSQIMRDRAVHHEGCGIRCRMRKLGKVAGR